MSDSILPSAGTPDRLQSLLGLRESQKKLCNNLYSDLQTPQRLQNEIIYLRDIVNKSQARLTYLEGYTVDLKGKYIAASESLDEINKQIKIEENASGLAKLQALQRQIDELKAAGVDTSILLVQEEIVQAVAQPIPIIALACCECGKEYKTSDDTSTTCQECQSVIAQLIAESA